MSLIRSPRRWRQTLPPTSAKPGPKASPPRSSSEAASLIRGRSLPPGRPSEESSRHPPAEATPPQTARPRGVHRRSGDCTARRGAAAPDREPQGDIEDVRTTASLFLTASGRRRTPPALAGKSSVERTYPPRSSGSCFRSRLSRLASLHGCGRGGAARDHPPPRPKHRRRGADPAPSLRQAVRPTTGRTPYELATLSSSERRRRLSAASCLCSRVPR